MTHDDEVLALCRQAEQGDEAARDTLYDDHGINDEDRAALLTHHARSYTGWANALDRRTTGPRS